MDKDIAARLDEAMREYELDALISYSKENIAYGLGYTIPSQALNVRDRQFALAVNQDGEAALLLTANEVDEARSRGDIDDLRPYEELTDDPMQVLAGALRDLGVERHRIGIELDVIPVQWFERLKRMLPDATFVAGRAALQHARRIKTPCEIEKLRNAARIADIAQADAHSEIRVGMTERDVYRLIVDRCLGYGADEVLLVQVAATERSAYSNPTPTDRVLRRGDVLKIDVFVSVAGYVSDTGRWIVMGEASPRHREVWARMQETMDRIHEAIRPGVEAGSVWTTFADEFARHDMKPAIKFLGHGLGLGLHEDPFIAADVTAPLEQGMVLAVEPIFREGEIGYHFEDDVLVTSDGMENLTGRLGRDILVLG
ncbi:MAG TPA: Xaa-Pro peptidase family protein [Solirubrobacteraceae bacterium]|nr:Xaa-Pro peptidase family protein [Solirubrobacteraceae bacterium]